MSKCSNSLLKRLIDLSHFVAPSCSRHPHELAENTGSHARSSTSNAQGALDVTRGLASSSVDRLSSPQYHNPLSILRPSRGNVSVQDSNNRQRQIQICDGNFPKRARTQPTVPVPEESSLGKLIGAYGTKSTAGLTSSPAVSLSNGGSQHC